MSRLVNWAGNHAYAARRVHRPGSLDELREIVAAADSVKVLGTRHAFHGIGDADELVSLAGLPAEVEVDGSTVSLGAATTYGDLARRLGEEGLALHNLASLPHISVAGAVATATHGSGDGNGNLATAVSALELVTSDGGRVKAARGDPDFDGMVVGLGALGAVTRLSLDVQPAYEIAQHVYEDLGWEALYEHFDAIAASGYSVSVFTTWGERVDQVWVKARAGEPPPRDLFGARPATAERHPIPGMDPVHCTPQLGRPGPWSERLPHFRMGFTPSAGDELQSELLVARAHAVPALRAVRALSGVVRPALQVCELRTTAADGLWLSPQYRQDTASLHFTWRPDAAAVARALREVEAALAELAPRPHWGKLFRAGPEEIARRYERLPDFARLRERLDPRGAFRNAWLDDRVLAGAGR